MWRRNEANLTQWALALPGVAFIYVWLGAQGPGCRVARLLSKGAYLWGVVGDGEMLPHSWLSPAFFLPVLSTKQALREVADFTLACWPSADNWTCTGCCPGPLFMDLSKSLKDNKQVCLKCSHAPLLDPPLPTGSLDRIIISSR